MKYSTSCLVTATSLAATAFCLVGQPATASQSLGSEMRTNGELMHSLVAAAQQTLQKSSASLYYDRNEEVVYGTVISPVGHILTKASEIRDKKNLSLRIDRRSYPISAVLAEDSVWDIALIKVDATDLTPVTFADDSELDLGTWVVTNGASTRFQRRPMIGIVSAKSREIKADGGPVLGVQIEDHAKGLLVKDVPEKTAASTAGLKKGDILTAIDATPLKNRKEFSEFMQQRRVGEKVEITYLRAKQELKTTIELAGRADTFGGPKSRNDSMSGNVSKRRSGFPRVIQHDIIGDRQSVGGPLLDLEGKCVGMNIARANRCESFAIPVAELRQIIQALMQDKPAK